MFYFGGYKNYFVKRGCDEIGQVDDIGFFVQCCFQDFFVGYYYVQVDYFIVIILEDDVNDIFVDIVYIVFYCCYDDFVG